MYKTIKKRDGRVNKFDFEKLVNAITRAGEATGEFESAKARTLALKTLNIAQETIKEKTPSVEQIQDIVEEVLLASSFKQTAKAYILYREQRRQLREITSKFSTTLMDQYLDRLDWQVKENSNMGYSLQGLNNYVSSEVTKTYWLNKIYPEDVRDAHLNGDYHIHDLNLLAVYCVGWDLMDLLLSGFKGVAGKIESAPAKHFRSALGQVVNFFYTLQGEAAGAQALSNFDTLLAPFIRYDNLGEKEVRQALQEFLFNVNVPTRVGFQTPFTNITLDLKVPGIYKDQNVVVGGEYKSETYGDFQKEMDMLNKCLLELMAEGDNSGRVFTFPIPTINITNDFDWDNKNLNSLWEVTAKYGIPYFSNFINSSLNPEDARSMCCRLRIDNTKLKVRGGGLFGANPLTGSVGVVTINMPRIGYKAKTKKEFLELLEEIMDIAKESLEIKRHTLEKFTEKDLYPYTKFYLRNIHKKFGEYWSNHFSTIGLVGMNEACVNFLGKDITTPEGNAFAEEVMNFMLDKLDHYIEDTGHNYNLEATPAESTSYRLSKADALRYPDIVTAAGIAHEANTPFYTNSTHLPVNFTDDIFGYLDLQDNLQTKYTGGTVVHLFVGEKINDLESVKSLVKNVCNNYKLPYFSITPTFSVCPEHGYLSGEHVTCEKCDSVCEVYSRIVGYLRPLAQWNDGKQAEYVRRKSFNVQQK
ncbi:MAG: ribonucleoside triphosphate reductase [Patescibacteria group bacterium]